MSAPVPRSAGFPELDASNTFLSATFSQARNCSASAHELFSYPASGLVATVNKIRERPEEIKKTIKAGIRANQYIAQNRNGTIQGIMEWLKIDRGTASATYDSVAKAFNSDGGVPEVGLRLVIEEAKKTTKVNREASINEAMDLSILRQAQRELGIGSR
jgi:ABC-type nitrate/sulfonate/bicarbonate transport system substrate-binding protein